MSEHNSEPKLAGGLRKKPLKLNRTPQNEPRWFKPLENDSISIFFFVLPVLLLERGGCTLLTAPRLYILTGLSHTHMFRSDRILEILEISG